MDMQSVLTRVESWPVDDRLRLMDPIWAGLLGQTQGNEPGLSEAEMAEIDRRLAEDDAAPDDVVPWEIVKEEAFRRAGW